MMKKKLLIIFGAPSPEYYVSCEMTKNVIENIDYDKYNVFLVGITKDGNWLYTKASATSISDGETWLKDESNRRAIVSPETNNSLLIFKDNNIETVKIDVAFITIPGSYGEDGKLPALLEMANIPFVGSGSIASGCSLDKIVTRYVADSINLRQAPCVVLKKFEYLNNQEFYINEIKKLKYPLFIKPSITGSSIGISKVINESKIISAIDKAFEYCDDVLVEEGISGSELKVALFGNKDVLEAGSLCQLDANNEGENFNDYETKYHNLNGGSIKKIPAEVDDSIKAEVIRQAKAIFNALNCRDFARVDFFLTEKSEIVFNEINTIPGFKDSSIYSLMMIDKGYSYKEVVNGLIEMAQNR